MQALRVTRPGEPRDALQMITSPTPEPADGQILVQVRAGALNFPDVLLCRGQYQVRPDLPFTPGFELCGEVVTTGADVTNVAPGHRVLGRAALPHGAFAEYALMTASVSLPAPDVLDDAEAAAFHVAYQTAWFGLHRRARLQAGETILVHAAAGGVGSAAVQLGKAMSATVVGVTSTAAKAAVVRAMGADLVVDRSTDDFVQVVRDATGGKGADVIYDPIGGDTYDRSTKCVAFEGRIVIVGFAGGRIQTAPLNHALLKNYSILGLHWGLYEGVDPKAVHECHAELSRLASEGRVRPLVSERIRLGDVPTGLQRLADGETTGRVIWTH